MDEDLKNTVFRIIREQGYDGGALFIVHGDENRARQVADIVRDKANGQAPTEVRYFDIGGQVPVACLDQRLSETKGQKKFLVVLNDGSMGFETVREVYDVAARKQCLTASFSRNLECLSPKYTAQDETVQ